MSVRPEISIHLVFDSSLRGRNRCPILEVTAEMNCDEGIFLCPNIAISLLTRIDAQLLRSQFGLDILQT